MKFKFYLTSFYYPDNYSPEVIAIAEGFKKMGIEFISNINYWFIPEEKQFLIKKSDNVDYDVCLYDSRYLYHSKTNVLNSIEKGKINILIDRNRWLSAIWNDNKVVDKFDLILLGNMLNNVSYPANVVPWTIGNTTRVMKYIDRFRINDIESMQNEVAQNFRVAHNVRGLINDSIKKYRGNKIPINIKTTETPKNMGIVDSIYQKQTANRHNLEYYKIINKNLFTLSYGGYYEYLPHVYQPYSVFDKIIRKPNYWKSKILNTLHKDIAPSVFVFQYDSFRLWETLYSSTVPILLDFEYWNFKLPVMPTEGEHYIGIKGFNVDSVLNRINKMSKEEVFEIGKNGKEWIQKNYSPQAVAERLINHINSI